MSSLLVASPRGRRKKGKAVAGNSGGRHSLVPRKIAATKRPLFVLEAEELALHAEISAAVARDLGR